MKKQLARLACLSLLAAACSAEHPLATGDPATDRMSVIPNVKGQWTYFSMVTHTVVGTCAVTDTLAQQAYAARTDWDIAIADVLEKRLAICMTCGRVGSWKGRPTFEELAVMFEGSTAEIVRLANWDTVKTNKFAIRAIAYLLNCENEKLPKEMMVAFE